MKEKEKFKIGDIVSWMTVNGPCSGVICELGNKYAFISISDVACVVVDFDSLTKSV